MPTPKAPVAPPAPQASTEIAVVAPQQPEVQATPGKVDLKELSQTFTDLISGGREHADKKAEERAKAAEPEGEPAEPATATVKPKAKESKAKEAEEPVKESKRRKSFTPPPPPQVDAAEIASRTAAETVERLGRAEKKPSAATVEEQIEALPTQHRRHVAVLHKMEALNPERYQGIATETIQALGKINEYKRKWQSENPGKKFDEDDSEHESFYELVEPQFDDGDYHEAQIEMRVAPLEKLSKKVEETQAKIAEYEKQEAGRQIQPAIEAAKVEVAKLVIEQLNPEILKHAATTESIEAFAETDPIAVNTIIDHARAAGAIMGVASAIFDGKGSVSLDFEDPTVKAFYGLEQKFEQQLKALPVSDQYDDRGRRFATWSEYNALIARDPANRERYWILDRETLPELIASEFSKNAQKVIEQKSQEFERTAKARGFAPSKSAHTPQNGNGAPRPAPTTVAPAAPSAPSGRTSISAQPETPPKKSGDWRENFLGRMFPR